MKKRKIINIRTLSLIIFGLGINVVQAVERQPVRNLFDPNLSRSVNGSEASPLSDARLATRLGLSADVDQLQARKTYTDSNGDTTIRYSQLYRGIAVIGDEIIVTRDSNNRLTSAHGYVVNGIADDLVNVVPTMTGEDAMVIAKETSANKIANTVTIGDLSYENETHRLVVWQDDAGTARLVYEVDFLQHGAQLARPYYLIDAHSGEVLTYLDNLQHVEAQGTGPGGNQKTGRYRYDTDRGFLDITESNGTCTMENSNVRTIDLNHGSSTGSTAFSFPCYENTHKEINGAYSPLNDAHYFGNVVFDMYREWLGTRPLTNQLMLKVHWGTRIENAGWTGDSMLFGDGHRRFYPLVGLDIVAHEVSHGFTEQNSNLFYAGKSGGLNEAFSDMSGQAAEYYFSGSNDWLVGGTILKADGGLRYMNDPPKDSRSIDHQSQFRQGMDVHYSSGVYNKAFYLLATSRGWNVRKAFEVYARANKQKWSRRTNWDDAGSGVLDVACELGYNTHDVQKSLVEVGVDSTISPPLVCAPPAPSELAWLNPAINVVLF